MTAQPPAPVEIDVTQADLNAAARHLGFVDFRDSQQWGINGSVYTLARVLAAHRLTAIAATKERDAGIAEAEANRWWGILSESYKACHTIATAIRGDAT